MKNSIPSPTLLVTGPPGAHNATNSDYFKELKALRDKLGLANGTEARAVFFAEVSDQENSFLPDQVIAELFRVADALLVPSFDEGFGIPVIEAGISRMPIYCSELPSFREIAQDFPLYFKPDEPTDRIAERIAAHLLSDKAFLFRRRIRQQFDWDSLFQSRILPLVTEVTDVH